MNRQERRRWIRRHVAHELAARSSEERWEAPEDSQPRDDGVPDEHPFVLPFELVDEASPAPDHANGPTSPAPTPPAATNGAPSRNDGSVDLLIRAAEEAVAAGDPQRAASIYRELLAGEPGHVSARRRLAELLDAAGEAEAALEELERCPDSADAGLAIARATLLGELRRFGEAERDLRGVLRAEPANAEAHFQLGVVISKKGLWRDAIPYLRRAVELDSARAAAHHYLGEALNHVDDLDAALQSYQRAAELSPNNAKTLYGLGIVLDRLNRPDDAAQMYRRSRELAGR